MQFTFYTIRSPTGIECFARLQDAHKRAKEVANERQHGVDISQVLTRTIDKGLLMAMVMSGAEHWCENSRVVKRTEPDESPHIEALKAAREEFARIKDARGTYDAMERMRRFATRGYNQISKILERDK